MEHIGRLIVRAPNPLGDAIMSLPAMAVVRAAFPEAHLVVAAVAAVAPLFEEITVALPNALLVVDKTREASQLREARADAAVLLTNSFRTAWVCRQAGIPERWGYRAYGRSMLLTQAIPRPRQRVHQSEYYLHLVRDLMDRAGLKTGEPGESGDRLDRPGLKTRAPHPEVDELGDRLDRPGLKTRAPHSEGGESGDRLDRPGLKTRAPHPEVDELGDRLDRPGLKTRTPHSEADEFGDRLDRQSLKTLTPHSGVDVGPGSSDPGRHPQAPLIQITPETRRRTDLFLEKLGVDRAAPLVGFAPGAAYGHAKRWPPDRVAQVVARLGARGAICVLVGAGGDREAGREIESSLPAGSRVINLIGRTDLRLLTGLLASCHAFVSNDSGAMHLAAAVGVPVAAIFGPTDERVTAPLGDHDVIVHQVFCRPCMLRDCPIDHRCMRRVSVDRVFDAVVRRLDQRGASGGPAA